MGIIFLKQSQGSYLFPNNYQSYIKKPRRESKDIGEEQTIRLLVFYTCA